MQPDVFANRILNMKKIKYIGLDMDHTLIRYQIENFESLVYDSVINKLIHEKKYPSLLKDFVFQFRDAIRGLVIDSKNGNILKLSRYGAIRESYHGTKPISFSEQAAMYRSIYVDLGDPNYYAVDTSFSIAFCALYGQLVDLKDLRPTALPNYQTIALDVIQCVDDVHAQGDLKAYISRHLNKFIIKDKAVVDGLKRYIEAGKKIFILTNSDYYYTNLLLEYAITPFLEPNQSWKDLFEYVITLANKPRFFYDNLKFLNVIPENNSMTNHHGKIKPGIYQSGNAKKFTDDLGLNGDEILYIGDHIYGDILRLKKDCNWRTALVVEELGAEIASQIKSLPIEKKITEAMELKIALESEYIECYSKNDIKNKEKMHSIQKKISDIDHTVAQYIHEQRQFFNTKWGRIFRAGAEESYFAYQVDRFACIYMEKLSDLLMHSPITYFRANRRLLAHDIQNLRHYDE